MLHKVETDAQRDLAARAIVFAREQLGKEYVLDAAGPNAFDCSGLTMMAWRYAGIALPHNSLAQFQQTQRVIRKGWAPEPGDLVFYYPPTVHHCALYLGRNRRGQRKVIQASAPGLGIEIIGIDDYAQHFAWGRVKFYV